MTKNTMEFIYKCIEEGKKVAMVTITETGSGTPGSVGQIIAVLEDGTTFGTVGGGSAEFTIINKSVEAIKNNLKTFEFSFELSSIGMICGGYIKGYGVVLGNRNKLVIFGGGHVAQCLYNIARITNFNVIVIEDREEFRDKFKDAKYIISSDNSNIDNSIFDLDTYIVVTTRGHKFDYDALKTSLEKNVAYIGMIGSKTKVSSIFEKLLSNGVEKEKINNVYSPIGLEISDGSPEEIAISIMAEILKVKNNGNLKHMKKEV